MSTTNLSRELEALLFVSDEPATVDSLSSIVGVSPDSVREGLLRLRDEYEGDGRGFLLREVAGGWRLFSNPVFHESIERYVISWDTRKLSQAALEALAVIAYRQPVTRAAVNSVRGVNSEAVMGSLLEKGLIREIGREKSAGNAILYGTSTAFLEKFGLRGIEELPPLEQFSPQEGVAEAIRHQLDATLPHDDAFATEHSFDLLDDES